MSDNRSASGTSNGLARTTLALTFGTGVAVFAFIGARSLWMDEALTAWAVRVDAGTFADVVTGHSANLGLYYLLMRAWSTIGTSEAALRGFSALWAVATVPVFVALARRLAGPRVALIGGLLLAAQPFLISLAREARPYTLVAFLATASTLAFVRAIEEPSAARWIAYTVLTVLGVYAHAYAGLIPVVHAASLPSLPRERIPWRRALPSAAAAAVLLAPLAVASLSQAGGLVEWVPALGPRWVYENANSFTQGLVIVPVWLRIAQLVLYAGAGALGISALVRRARFADADPLMRWRSRLVLLWAALPILVVIAVSFVKPLLVARYLVGSLPALVLVAAAGLNALRPVTGRIAVAVLLVASVTILGFLYAGPNREDWRGATGYLATQTGPGERVYAAIEFGLPDVPLPTVGLEYYADRVDPPLQADLLPAEALMPEPGTLAAGLPTRIWVVTSGLTRLPFASALVEALQRAGYEPTAVRRFGGIEGPITVVRLER